MRLTLRKHERLEKLVAAFKQPAFGRKSEKTDPNQFDHALEDLEAAMAFIHAEDALGRLISLHWMNTRFRTAGS